MNQHDQMREALEAFQVLATLTQNTTALHVIREQCRKLHKALAAEHASLVRLTDEEALMAYFSIKQRDFVPDNTIRIERLRAVMDATIAKNSAKPAQTEPTPEQHAQFAGSITKALGKGGV